MSERQPEEPRYSAQRIERPSGRNKLANQDAFTTLLTEAIVRLENALGGLEKTLTPEGQEELYEIDQAGAERAYNAGIISEEEFKVGKVPIAKLAAVWMCKTELGISFLTGTVSGPRGKEIIAEAIDIRRRKAKTGKKPIGAHHKSGYQKRGK